MWFPIFVRINLRLFLEPPEKNGSTMDRKRDGSGDIVLPSSKMKPLGNTVRKVSSNQSKIDRKLTAAIKGVSTV